MPLTFDIEEGIRWEGEEDNREVEQEWEEERDHSCRSN